ncbi:MAG TPA: hypothetical protein DIU42_02945 [Dermacoccus sp.]|nr:hypothetical protein [Dermacoccus sp.]
MSTNASISGATPTDGYGSSGSELASARVRSRRPALIACLAVVVAVLLANAVYLLGVRSNDPMLYHSGLGSPTHGLTDLGPGGGHYPHTIDANDGWTVQSLGRLSAEMWKDGQLPLWNSFEGLGQPLAGEQQSAAFFQPFIMLNLLPNGSFLMHLALELVAGLTMLAFLRSLRLTWVASTVGGILFAINGAFSVMTNAPFNPIAFLPMVLWGVELVAADVQRRARPRWGIVVIALGLAWMLYAGFPETALIQGLVVAAWVLVRAIALRPHRVRFVLWNGVGALGGVLLAAPLLITLRHFLGFAFTAYHGGGERPPWKYTAHAFYGFFGGYLGGPFSSSALMDGVAGYVTLASLLCAVIGLFGRRPRAIKIMLVTLVTLLMLNMFGVEWVNTMLYAIPGVDLVLLYKYGIILLVFVFTLLAAYGLDDLGRGRVRRGAVWAAAAVATAYVTAGVTYLVLSDRVLHPTWTSVVAALFGLVIIALTAAFVWGSRAKAADPERDDAGARHSPTKRAASAALVAGLVIVAEAGASYATPQLNASPPKPIDTAPPAYLQEHLGTSRFFTLGPIQPNYGSYWQLAELNVNDLPVPEKYSTYVMDHLRPPSGTPAYIKPTRGFNPFMPYLLVTRNSPAWGQKRILTAYGQQQAAYRDAGVKYLVAAPGVVDDASASRLGLRRVFGSTKAEIFEDPAARPYYDTRGACRVENQTRESVTLDCSRPTTLVRRELSTPGWSATINGTKKHLPTGPDKLFQTVQAPAGRSTISFAYRPPHFRAATALSLVTLAALCLQLVPLRTRRRQESEGGSAATRSEEPRSL